MSEWLAGATELDMAGFGIGSGEYGECLGLFWGLHLGDKGHPKGEPPS